MAESKKFKYRNKSDQAQALIGYGKVEPGDTIGSDEPIYNPNFVLVDGGRMVNVEKPVGQPKASEKGKK